MATKRKTTGLMVTLSAVVLLAAGTPVGTALAQDDSANRREQVRDQAQDPRGDMLRDRIRDRIRDEQGLEEQDRTRLRQHLAECDQLGLDDEITGALFAEGELLKNQVRIQERVLAMAREGLPVEPVMQKVQEGRSKGAKSDVLDRVSARMEANVRAAHRVMNQVREDGVHAGTPDAERRHTRDLAGAMWSGLNKADMDQLRDRARQRLRDGSCTTEDFTAAAETASRLQEMRVERQRAVGLAGEALQNGYTAREMQQLRWMVMTANMHGGPTNDVLNTLEQGLRNQHQLTHMMREMQQHGWMGPADEHGGHGAMSPDNTGGSGPGGGQHGGNSGGGDKGHGGGGGGGNGTGGNG